MLFDYRANAPLLRFTTDRMVVRLAHERDAHRISDYYCDNEAYLRPWEPIRDRSHYHPSGWNARLQVMTDMHRQATAFHFLLLDPQENEVIGVANYSNVIRGVFYACFLGYSIGEKWQGQHLMEEALQPTIRWMQRQQGMHRIMANYMPHNQRSGQLLSRLGFEKEGYAKEYLMINGQWRDHVLTALTTPGWVKPR